MRMLDGVNLIERRHKVLDLQFYIQGNDTVVVAASWEDDVALLVPFDLRLEFAASPSPCLQVAAGLETLGSVDALPESTCNENRFVFARRWTESKSHPGGVQSPDRHGCHSSRFGDTESLLVLV